MSRRGDHADGSRRATTLEDLPSLQAFGALLVEIDEGAVARAPRRPSAFLARVRSRRERENRPGGTVRGRRSTTMAALVGSLAALTSFTGAAAVALTAATGSPVPSFARGDDTGIFPAPGTVRIADARAQDPDGGLPWTVRVGRSSGGLVCLGVGQLRGSVFGIRGTDGRFRATSPVGNDSCGPTPRASAPVVALRGFSGPSVDDPAGATTLVFGSGGAGLQSVVVRTGDGQDRRPSPAADGTFVVALDGWPEGAATATTLRWTDGRERTVRLGPSDGTVPDPTGTFAWSNDAVFRVHVHGRSSPRGCLDLVRVREFGRHRDGSPVCVSGVSGRALVRQVRLSAGRSRTILAVAARRGDHVVVRVGARTFPVLLAMTAGDPVRRVVRRGGTRRVVRRADPVRGPRAAIAILPAGVPPSSIEVRVFRDGRSTLITDVRGAPR